MAFNPDEFLATAQGGVQQPEVTATSPEGEQQQLLANLGVPPIQQTSQTPETSAQEAGFDPDAFLHEAQQQKYGTPEQQVKAGIEGAAKGALGPLATFIEKDTLGVKPEDITGRAEANPWTHGLSEAAGMGAGMLLPGEGQLGVLTKVGELAQGATGLGKAAEASSYAYKVGSEAVKQAAEMAIMQSGDEVSKMILKEPNTSAQQSLADVGLAAALGGATGGVFAGAVNPLWKATVGDKLDNLLGGLKNHLDRGGASLPGELEQAANTLGINVDALQRGAHTSPSMTATYNHQKSLGNEALKASEDTFRRDVSDSVSNSLGIGADDVQRYSENEGGQAVKDAFAREYKEKYGPIAEALDKRKTEAEHIALPDEDRLTSYDQLLQKGMETFGTDSPHYKMYPEWGNRFLAKDTIGQLDALKTELNGEIKAAYRSGNSNVSGALNAIKDHFTDFQDNQINKQAMAMGGNGIAEAAQMGKDLLAERQAASQGYAKFANMSDKLMDHLGMGDFKGYGNLSNKIAKDITPEDILKKFSFKGDVELMNQLKEHFPQTYEIVRQSELKNFVKPSIIDTKGGHEVDVNKLAKAVNAGLAGKKEYIEALLSPEALAKIQAGRTVLDPMKGIIPSTKDSGTGGWIAKNMKGGLSTSMGVISAIMGHNPIVGGLIGHVGEMLQRQVPDAINLGTLRFLGSTEPVKAGAFKSMVDYAHAAYKGEATLVKAAQNVFKSGKMVLTEHQMPNSADREKLDKLVTQSQKNPDEFAKKLMAGDLGHYMPEHQAALAQAMTNQIQYLQALKPKTDQSNPFDTPVPPSPGQEARYNRALDIAEQPAVVLQHIKDGTLQDSDILDLHKLYPEVYQKMAQKLTNEATNQHANEEPIPYKTRMGVSLFLGQPMDSTMTPSAIIAAQPVPKPSPQQQQAQGAGGKSMKLLGKTNKSYMTPTQTAESDRANRE